MSSLPSPDPAVMNALTRMLCDPVWGSAYERACDSGQEAVRAKAAKFAAALAAREPDLDASVESVRAAFVVLAPEMHPDSAAACESLRGESPAASERGTEENRSWVAYCITERTRAITYICLRSADGNLPDLHEEFKEITDAVDALDRARFNAAVRTLVKHSLWEHQRKGTLLPEPSSLPERPAPLNSGAVRRVPHRPLGLADRPQLARIASRMLAHRNPGPISDQGFAAWLH